MQTLCPESGVWTAPNWPKIQKITMTTQFFWHCFVSLVKFSYWSKFHVNIITGSGIMTIFFYKGLIRNPEIPPSEFSQYLETGASYGYQIWQMFLINCDWMLQNSRVTAFTAFELLRENQLGGGITLPPKPDMCIIPINSSCIYCYISCD